MPAVRPTALLAMALTAAAPPSAGTPVSFLACPVAQDTGPDSDLCFFVEHDGQRYSLTNPVDYASAQLHHQVLVEGRVNDGPAPCGGLSVEGRFSVMPEIDPACDRIVPATPGMAYGPNAVSAERKAAASAMLARVEADPALSIRPIYKDAAPEPAPTPPFLPRNLAVYYPFDSDRGSLGDMIALMALVRYAQATHAHVTIRATRGQSRLDDGRLLSEAPGLARQRADKLRHIITGLGLDPARLTTDFDEGPAMAGGWPSRRGDIRVEPANRGR
ncbi:hypothetical protein [Novosphingobium rosa]|uniref:hypothetical protein n=1 Tax=Novosphingobium rosa TaxID=76978 RepID=UPI0008313C6B|nr:hypothetical protein [Novosphingobium rosa]